MHALHGMMKLTSNQITVKKKQQHWYADVSAYRKREECTEQHTQTEKIIESREKDG